MTNKTIETNSGDSIFEIIIAKKIDGNLNFGKNAGFSKLCERNGFYTIRLHVFPRTHYFLVKNFSSSGRYTLFSKIVGSEEGTKFQNPVGYGCLLEDVKTHLQINFLMPRMIFYMSLFPKKFSRPLELVA